MAKKQQLIPVETLELWIKKALQILKDGGKPGRYQNGLLSAVRNGVGMPADEYVAEVFLLALAAQKNVGKIDEGSNPKWRLFPVIVPDVVIPRGLPLVMYQAEPVVAGCTIADTADHAVVMKQLEPQKNRGRLRKGAIPLMQVSAEAQKPVVITLDPRTKLEVSEDQKLFILRGNLIPLLDIISLPFFVVGNACEVHLTAGELDGVTGIPCVSFLLGSITVERVFDITIVIGRVEIKGPFSQVILKYGTSFR